MGVHLVGGRAIPVDDRLMTTQMSDKIERACIVVAEETASVFFRRFSRGLLKVQYMLVSCAHFFVLYTHGRASSV